MDFANIQAQMETLTSLISRFTEKVRMQSVTTCDVSYGQGYQLHQCSQFTANGDAWGYQGYDQPSNNMFPNTYNSDWRDYSDYMWGEPQQFQQGGYWQQDEEFYSRPMQPPQQSAQFNSGTSMDNDTFNKLLTSLNQEVENQNKEMRNQAKKTGELEKQIGQIMEFMAQIQEQSEFSNATIENSEEDFEILDDITLGSAIEVRDEFKTSKHSLEVDELLLQEEEEEATPTARVEKPLPQSPKDPTPCNSGNIVPNSIHSNPIPPNVPFPRRFLIPKEEESEKDIVQVLPKVQVAGEHVECIKEDVVEITNAKEVEFVDTGQVTTIIVNLVTCKIPANLKEVVFVIEFVSEHKGKTSSPISITFYTYMLLMIQAPTLEVRPWPDHFKYHRPFKDKPMHSNNKGT